VKRVAAITVSRTLHDELDEYRPAVHVCSCGNTDFAEKVVQGTLYCVKWRKAVTVLRFSCNCGATYHFDGQSRGIINVDDHALFTRDILQDYLAMFRQTGASMNSYWMARIRLYEQNCWETWKGMSEISYIRTNIPSKVNSGSFFCFC
jgi:hypothetical protein